jgi:transcriptional regulator with XRE-family HTH domain
MGMETVAPYLREIRIAAGLTQGEAADRVGVHSKTVERWEAGKHEPPASELAAYVRALGGEVDRLMRLLVGGDPAPVSLADEESAWFAALSPEQKRKARALLDAAEGRLGPRE